MERIKACDYSFAPITDRASTFGWVRWAKLAKENGLRPIFGLELGVTESLNAKKPIVDYWTFIAKDNLLALHRLFELATTQFHKEPLLTYQQAMATDCSTIIGHRSNFELMNPAPNRFIGLSPSVSKGYFDRAKSKGYQFIATSDNKYPTREDVGLYEIVCDYQASTQIYDQHIQAPKEWVASVSRIADKETIDAALSNREAVAQASTAELTKGFLFKPERKATLRDMCERGAKRLGIDLENPIYKERIDRELTLIRDKGFEDYFYIIEDMVAWARTIMIVGRGRGSAAGSLVCYLLGITMDDPIPYGLIFERFLAPDRNDPPDIDLDFSDQQRYRVFEYLIKKYGPSHVARLGTVANYQATSALADTATALDIPKWEHKSVSECLDKKEVGDTDVLADVLETMDVGQRLIKKFPELAIATKLEGHPKHCSQHAAGVILTSEPVNNYVAIDRTTGAANCDKEDAEWLNLLKIDVLGLTQLSVFEDALEMAGLDRNTLDDIPLDDPEAFKILNDRRFAGIFQFNGAALQNITKQIKMENLEDIVAVTALARPGPLDSGATARWIERKKGAEAVSYPHPMFEPILKRTFGVLVYQEQIMELGRVIGDMTWPEVAALRKAVAKSKGTEAINKFGDKWKAGAIAKGGDPMAMQKYWDDICAFGRYAFNLSHSLSYGVISYQCCWLKAHYPFEFAAAALTHEEKPERQLIMLREMIKEGYDYIPVDQARSIDKWTLGQRDGKRILIGPVSNIVGIGPKHIQTILSARARNETLPSAVQKLLDHPKTPIDSLWPIADAIKKHDLVAKNIVSQPMPIGNIELGNEDFEVMVFCTFSKITQRDDNEEASVKRRGGRRIFGNSVTLNLTLMDDSGTIFGKINRNDYPILGAPILERGRAGKCLYAVKGIVKAKSAKFGDFRMIHIRQVRYIGDVDETN
jgi:DNA-directed DNA polymerase III PolC